MGQTHSARSHRFRLAFGVAAALFVLLLTLAVLVPLAEQQRQTERPVAVGPQQIELRGTVDADQLHYLYEVATGLGLDVSIRAQSSS